MIRIFAVLICCGTLLAADNIDSLLNEQRIRAGSRADTLFEYLDSKSAELKPEEVADLRFLLAYLPLADIAVMNGDQLLENIRLAEKTRTEFAWGKQVSDAMFRNFVLPHRVTQEPYVARWRKMFYEELAPRVKRMSMTEAALEVNHWCHEHATYQPSDGRDQDPLTTIRAGLGRCEEEMILAICALRSVGIPARQCYTPYWPHTDDNHAWVEVWADGKWHYFGACEPDVNLNRAWFTDAAARTMLVVSTSYGKYEGDEPVLREVGKTTMINSTAVYGKTHTVRVKLEDQNGKPVVKQPVVFSLFNYGSILPAVSLETDANGEVNLVCGLGDWFVSAGKDGKGAFRHLTVADTNVVLRLLPPDSMRSLTSVEFTPPPAVKKSDDVKPDSLFACRLTNEAQLRESSWKTWADEWGIKIDSTQWKPDSLEIMQIAEQCSLDGSKVYDLMLKARGNWGRLYRMLVDVYPDRHHTDLWKPEEHWLLLDQLTDKDARDFGWDQFSDYQSFFSLIHPSIFTIIGLIVAVDGRRVGSSPGSPGIMPYLSTLDSLSRDRFEKYVIAPRIDKEPSRAWRRVLIEFLEANKKLIESQNDKAMIKWLRKNITVDKDRDRLGPPLTPAECLNLRRGAVEDIERLYIGLCRVREIPARFDPVFNVLQRWEKDHWLNVDLGIREQTKVKPSFTGQLTLMPADSDSTTLAARYNREWGVQKWEGDRFSDLDFGFETAFKDQTWPKDLPVGLYCISSGIRREDGSVRLKLVWFEIKKGERTDAVLGVK